MLITNYTLKSGGYSEKEVSSLIKLQGICRGRHIRKEAILPYQLKEVLAKSLLKSDSKNVFNTSFAICREILKITTNPKLPKEYKLLNPSYTYPKFGKDNKFLKTNSISVDSLFYYKIVQNGHVKEIEIFLKPSEPLIGYGAYRKVSKALEFTLILEENKKEMIFKPKICSMIRLNSTFSSKISSTDEWSAENSNSPDGSYSTNSSPSDTDNSSHTEASNSAKKLSNFEELYRVLEIHKNLFKLSEKGAKITTPPVQLDLNCMKQGADDNFEEEILMKQDWYNSDLNLALERRFVPLNLSFSSEIELAESDFAQKPEVWAPVTWPKIFNVLNDVAKSLKILHEEGYIHRDLKEANVLIKISGQEFEGFLHDFDYTTKIGVGWAAEYKYWDRCSEKGYVTPFCDYYGFAMMLTRFSRGLNNLVLNPKSIYDQTFAEGLQKIKSTHILNYIRKNKLEEFQNSLKNFKYYGDVLNALRELLVNTGKENEFEELSKETSIIDQVYQFIYDAIRTDHDIFTYFLKNPSIKKCLEEDDFENKKKLHQQLAETFVFYGEFYARFKDIYELVQQSFSGKI